jgi:hypothetical protein
MSDIRSDVVEEALRIADRAKQEELALRLLGGMAIRLRAKDGQALVRPARRSRRRGSMTEERDGFV